MQNGAMAANRRYKMYIDKVMLVIILIAILHACRCHCKDEENTSDDMGLLGQIGAVIVGIFLIGVVIVAGILIWNFVTVSFPLEALKVIAGFIALFIGISVLSALWLWLTKDGEPAAVYIDPKYIAEKYEKEDLFCKWYGITLVCLSLIHI